MGISIGIIPMTDHPSPAVAASEVSTDIDAPIDLADALDRIRSLVRSEAGRIAYFEDELAYVVAAAKREASSLTPAAIQLVQEWREMVPRGLAYTAPGDTEAAATAHWGAVEVCADQLEAILTAHEENQEHS
jgi:hypothetical protein